jgi:hypothetical protein
MVHIGDRSAPNRLRLRPPLQVAGQLRCALCLHASRVAALRATLLYYRFAGGRAMVLARQWLLVATVVMLPLLLLLSLVLPLPFGLWRP